ncbi:MAG: hypothetical protein IH606_11805 [Burkholderiales bacterium]|nr:hypothetical protein [Burkholderiales bacterium]
MTVNKVIVTNLAVLQGKYSAGFRRVRDAIARLIAADKKRGLTTLHVAIDSAVDMRSAGGSPVTTASDRRQAKAAIDAVWTAYTPDYLMILGAPDVVPMQILRNPTRGDGDANVPSDLPYACAAPYSSDPSAFLGPTRVVGRLPDLLGGTNPAYLVSLLGTAARYRMRPREAFQRYLGLSAQVWQASTALSLAKVFGNSTALQTTPPRGPNWTNAQLARRAHFINCHGAESSPQYYGQPDGKEEYPVAHEAARLKRKVSNGTVIAAECCYGAQLYDPQDSAGQAGICSTYLADGAYGFFGSTTIAYGPSEGNGQADLICQFFLDSVLNGASLGRATLEARQRFVALYTHLDPTDLKTLTQFYLLGDPSIQAVGAVPHALSRTKAFKSAFKGAKTTTGGRAFRRERLARTGTNLARSVGATRPVKTRPPTHVTRALNAIAKESRIKELSRQSYAVSFPTSASSGDMKQFAATRRGRSVYVLFGEKITPDKVKRVVALAATVEDGKIVHMRRVHSR